MIGPATSNVTERAKKVWTCRTAKARPKTSNHRAELPGVCPGSRFVVNEADVKDFVVATAADSICQREALPV
jgi:hypothetical protein